MLIEAVVSMGKGIGVSTLARICKETLGTDASTNFTNQKDLCEEARYPVKYGKNIYFLVSGNDVQALYRQLTHAGFAILDSHIIPDRKR